MAVRVSRISRRTCFRRPAVQGFLAFAAIEGPALRALAVPFR